MPPTSTRRTCLRRIAATAALAGLAATPAAVADCDATVYGNADGGGKLEGPAGEATITGESTCAPDIDRAVQARSSDGSSPAVFQAPATVTDGGGFAAEFALGNADPPQSFEVTVRHDDGTTLATFANCEGVAGGGDGDTATADTDAPTGTGDDGDGDGATATETTSPGFGIAAAVAGLALAARRLRGDS